MLDHHNAWGEDRVVVHDAQGRLRAIPAGWTDVVPQEAFVVLSAGRSMFRIGDLIAIVALVKDLLRYRNVTESEDKENG